MRTHGVGLGLTSLALVGGIGWGLLGIRDAASASVHTENSGPREAAVARAQQRHGPSSTNAASLTRTLMAAAKARPESQASSMRAAEAKRAPMPKSLDEVELTARQEAMLARFSPLQRTLYEYKLGLLHRMRECTKPLGAAQGKMSAYLHFRVDPSSGFAEALAPELIDSSLPEGADARALECITKAHAGTELDLRGESFREHSFHWATDIGFPLDEDPAYELFAPVDESNDTEEEDDE